MDTRIDFNDPSYSEFLTAGGLTAENAEAFSLFHPGILKRRFEAFRSQTRFVHYTSAEVGLSIIRTKGVWLRNAAAMNDYRELHHGIDRVINFFGRHSDAAKPFWERLKSLHDGVDDEIIKLFDGWVNDLRFNTYMVCLSEHGQSEDILGRLSMWRAYAPRNGVAFVLKPDPFHSATDALEAYGHPVLYYSDDALKSVFEGIVAEITTSEMLPTFSRDEIKNHVFHMFETFSVGLKHSGFEEEREWRVVHSPGRSKAKRIPCSVQVVRGMPQRVYCLSLQNVEGEGLTGITLPELLDRVIVGPSQLPLMTYEAFVDELADAGVVDAATKVVISDIPLRT